jgi:hypothetical protein
LSFLIGLHLLARPSNLKTKNPALCSLFVTACAGMVPINAGQRTAMSSRGHYGILVILLLVTLTSGVRAESVNSASARASLQAECSRQATKKFTSKQERRAYIKHCMATVDNYAVEPAFIEPR